MWKLTPWPLHSNTYHPPLLLGLKLLFPVLLEKQKCLEHGKSSWEKQKLDNIQFSSNTLWVTSLVETMDIQSIRQVGNTALLYFFKSSKLVDDTSFRGAQLEKHLFISDDICEFTCAQMCKAHSLSLCSDNVINSPCPGSAAICYGPIVTQGLPLPVFFKKRPQACVLTQLEWRNLPNTFSGIGTCIHKAIVQSSTNYTSCVLKARK